MIQVYERLEKLQVVVVGVFGYLEVVSCIFFFLQENFYVFSIGRVYSGVVLWQFLVVLLGVSVQVVEQLQRGFNQFVESDESLGGFFVVLCFWYLILSCFLDLVFFREVGCFQGDMVGELSWGSGLGFWFIVVEGLVFGSFVLLLLELLQIIINFV